MHDDRFYVLILLAQRLYELRRGTIVSQQPIQDITTYFMARPAKRYE